MLSAITAQAETYYYNGSGAVNAVGSWFTNRNGTGASPANFTTAGNTFVIQNGQSPALGSAWTISGAGSGLLIETGGAMNSGANNPILTLSMENGASYTSAHTSWSSLTFGTINSGSTFFATGAPTTLIERAYGNLVWQSTGGNVTPGNNLTTTGNLTIASGSELRTATGTTPRTWTIGGSILINSGSTWNLTNGSTGTGTTNITNGITNAGTINKTGAAAAFVNFTGTGSSDVTWGNVITTNFGTTTFNVNSTKTIVFLDSLNMGAATFNVDGTLNLGGQVLSGTSGNFTLTGGATLITSNSTGLDGAITVSGTKTFSTSANYEFQGAGTGSTLPSTVNNLTINRSSGNVTLDGSSATQTVSGSLNVYSGNLSAGATTNTVSTSALTMRNATINSGMTVNVSGGVTFDATSNGTATISGNLGLGGATRTFSIADGSASTDMSVSGVVSNGGIAKSGSGTLALSGNNTYSGGTSISAGTLTASHNNALGSGSATISGGTLAIGNGITLANTISLGASGTLSGTGTAALTGSLGGTGTLAGSLTLGSGANINPGNSPGILSNTGTLTFDSGSTYTWELAALSTTGAGTNFDQIANTGIINLNGGSLALSLGSYAPSADPFWTVNRSWTVISTTGGGSITGTALSISISQTPWSSYGSFSTGLSGQDMVVNWTAIPEPSTYAALAGVLALCGVMWHRRRQRLAAKA